MGSNMQRSERKGETEGSSGEERPVSAWSAGMSLRLGGVRKSAQWKRGVADFCVPQRLHSARKAKLRL